MPLPPGRARAFEAVGVAVKMPLPPGRARAFLLSRLDRLLAKTDGTVNSGAFM